MVRPLNRISRVSGAYLRPPHAPQSTHTSGRKLISIRIRPCPAHGSHRPPFTLKENRLAVWPRARASGTRANTFRISSKKPT